MTHFPTRRTRASPGLYENDYGNGVAPVGGVPWPPRMYSARWAAYSSGVRRSISPISSDVARKSRLRNGMHQPQPVPAPPHSESRLGTCGLVRRTKFSSFRRETWKQ